jgi:hypothetical protein
MIHDLMELCEVFDRKIKDAKKREQVAQEIISKGESGAHLQELFPTLEGDTPSNLDRDKLNKSDLIYFDEQVSMLERTAHKFYPIIQEVAKRMVKHKDPNSTTITQEKTSAK